MSATIITVEAIIIAPIEKVWEHWTEPKYIMKWNNASDDWHTPHAANDLRVGGQFLSRMEAKDGSFGFDLIGTYTIVELHKKIAYTIADGRQVTIEFSAYGADCKITEAFEAENINSIELQKGGWQAILNNFKKNVEISS